MNLDKPTVVIDNVIQFYIKGKWKLEIWIQWIIKKTSCNTYSVSFIISSIGRPKYQVVIPSTSNQSDAYMGDDLNSSKRGMFKLRYPIKHGVVDNWDDMQLLWKHTFSQLNIFSSQHPVLLTQPNLNPSKQRKKIL